MPLNVCTSKPQLVFITSTRVAFLYHILYGVALFHDSILSNGDILHSVLFYCLIINLLLNFMFHLICH